MAADLQLPHTVRGIIADCPYTSPEAIIRKVVSQDLRLPAGPLMPLVRLSARLFGGFSLSGASAEKIRRGDGYTHTPHPRRGRPLRPLRYVPRARRQVRLIDIRIHLPRGRARPELYRRPRALRARCAPIRRGARGMRRRHVLLIVILLALAALLAWAIWANGALTLTRVTLSSAEIPEEFRGFKIAPCLGPSQRRLRRGERETPFPAPRGRTGYHRRHRRPRRLAAYGYGRRAGLRRAHRRDRARVLRDGQPRGAAGLRLD